MEIFALRARGFGHPGNSVRALRAALHSRVSGILLDVRLTKNLQWVLAPDEKGKVEQRALFRLHTKSSRTLGANAVSLDAALALFAAYGQGKLLLLDARDMGEERALLALVRRHDLLDRTVILAWDERTLVRVHALAPSVRLGWCVAATQASHETIHVRMPHRKTQLAYRAGHTFDVPLAALARARANIELPTIPLSYVCLFALACSSDTLGRIHDAGAKAIAYPVNSAIGKSLLDRQHVDGILTSEPLSFS